MHLKLRWNEGKLIKYYLIYYICCMLEMKIVLIFAKSIYIFFLPNKINFNSIYYLYINYYELSKLWINFCWRRFINTGAGQNGWKPRTKLKLDSFQDCHCLRRENWHEMTIIFLKNGARAGHNFICRRMNFLTTISIENSVKFSLIHELLCNSARLLESSSFFLPKIFGNILLLLVRAGETEVQCWSTRNSIHAHGNDDMKNLDAL